MDSPLERFDDLAFCSTWISAFTGMTSSGIKKISYLLKVVRPDILFPWKLDNPFFADPLPCAQDNEKGCIGFWVKTDVEKNTLVSIQENFLIIGLRLRGWGEGKTIGAERKG